MFGYLTAERALRCQRITFICSIAHLCQKQLQGSEISPKRITKIFLTHLHGDHSFGLAGVLCLMGKSHEAEKSDIVVDIYGPIGESLLALAVCAVLNLSRHRHPRLCPCHAPPHLQLHLCASSDPRAPHRERKTARLKSRLVHRTRALLAKGRLLREARLDQPLPPS
jgi:hypothetical protein